MEVKNTIWTAVVRSLVQRGLEWLLATSVGAWILGFVTDLGFTIDTDSIATPVSIFLFGLIVAGVNWVGKRYPWVNKIISLGLSRTGPAYVPNNADAVVAVAVAGGPDRVEAVDVPPPGPNLEPVTS